jgi:hypothetical protein
MSSPLEKMARRVQDDPLFLAWALAEYARRERLDDDALAAALGCPVETLTPLRLCRTPGGGPAEFQRGVDRIAEHFGVDAEVIEEAVCCAEARRRLREEAGPRGMLLAARDAEPPDGGAPP